MEESPYAWVLLQVFLQVSASVQGITVRLLQ
jgi:hypothetical protein